MVLIFINRITADRIADLVLTDGNPGGTEVLIKIPVSYD